MDGTPQGTGSEGLSVPGVSGVWLKIAYVMKAPLAEPRYSTVTINFRFNVPLPVSCGRSLRTLRKERNFLNGFLPTLGEGATERAQENWVNPSAREHAQ